MIPRCSSYCSRHWIWGHVRKRRGLHHVQWGWVSEMLPAPGPKVPCLQSVRELSLSATLYCLDKAALVNLFSIFKTSSFFCQDHNFCLLASSLAKTIRIICITTEVFRVFLTEPCVWEVYNIKISNVFTGVFTIFYRVLGRVAEEEVTEICTSPTCFSRDWCVESLAFRFR